MIKPYLAMDPASIPALVATAALKVMCSQIQKSFFGHCFLPADKRTSQHKMPAIKIYNSSQTEEMMQPSAYPPLDIHQLGVEQPKLATKDVIIIFFMFLLWGYSLYLTYRAWYKILYSDGDEGTNMWR